MDKKLYLSGDKNNPSTWLINHKPNEAFEFFDDYESCRKWAIQSLISKRKEIGILMDLWMKRSNYDKNQINS